CGSLAELAAVAASLPGCVAFNTGAQLKSSVEAQVHWRWLGGGRTSWAGLYVRRDVAEARGLAPPLPGGGLHPRLRYFQRGKTRLLAARDCNVVWLNNTYLSIRDDPDAVVAAAAAATAAAAAAEGGAAGSAAAAGAAAEAGGGQHDDDGGEGGGAGEEGEEAMVDNDDYDPSDDEGEGEGDEGVGEEQLLLQGMQGRRAQLQQELQPQQRQQRAPPPQQQQQGLGAPPAAKVVRLDSVCWLQLDGTFYGVGPGRYRCAWWLRVAPDCNLDRLHFKVSVVAARLLDPRVEPAAVAAAFAPAPPPPPASAALAAAALADAERLRREAEAERGRRRQPPPPAVPPPPLPVVGLELAQAHASGAELMRRVGAGWYEQVAGEFVVPRGCVCDVAAALWNHGGSWKRGMMFREVVLERLGGEDGQGQG
ncbi:hypothetical protein TSOC_013596, partial [Tetrabaena socialis]